MTDSQTIIDIIEGRNPYAVAPAFYAADRMTKVEPAKGEWYAELDFDDEPGRLCEYLGEGRVQFEHDDADVRADGVFVAIY